MSTNTNTPDGLNGIVLDWSFPETRFCSSVGVGSYLAISFDVDLDNEIE